MVSKDMDNDRLPDWYEDPQYVNDPANGQEALECISQSFEDNNGTYLHL